MKAREKTREQLLKDLTSLRRKLTNARKALRGLQESGEQMKAFMAAATEAFIILDEDLNIVDLNEMALAYLPRGTLRSEVIGRNILDFVPYLKETPRYERYREIIRSGGVYHEDGVALTLGPKQRYLSVHAFKSGKGLGIIAADITERKLAEEALRQSEETFWTLAEQSPNMIFINIGGQVIYANARASEIMGYTREEFYSPDFDFLTLIDPESLDTVKEAFARHQRGEDIPPYEYTLRTKDGRRIRAINATRLIPYHGKTAILGIVTDITERKQAEEALAESEERYHRLADIAEEGIAIHDQGMIIEANEALGRMFGYTASEMIGTYAAKYATPETWQLILKNIAAGDTEPYEGQGVKKDGSTFWVELRGKPITYRGRPMRVGIFRDITERKRTEEEIRYLNSMLRAIRNVNQLLVREKDRRRLIEMTCTLLAETRLYQGVWIILFDEGGTAAAVAGTDGRFEEFIYRQRALPPCVAAARNQPGFLPLSNGDELCRRCPLMREGETFVGGCVRIEFGGHIFGAMCVHFSPEATLHEEERALILDLAGDLGLGLHNIYLEEEHKRAEGALRESETHYRTLFDSANDAIFTMEDDIFISCNAKTLEMFRCRREDILGKHPYDAEFSPPVQPDHRDSKGKALEKIGAAFRGESQFFEWKHRRWNAETFDAEVSLNRFETARGPRLLAVVRDITDRKRAEEALRESEERFRALIEHSADGIAVISPDGIVTYTAPANDRILGYGPGDNPGAGMFDFIHPDDHPKLREALAQILAEPNRVITSDFRARHRDGSWRTIEVTGRNLIHAPAVGGIVVNFRDITERKQAEEALAESEEKWRSLVQNAPSLIVNIDRGGIIQFINHTIPPFKPEEIIGRSLWEFISPDSREIAERAIQAAFETGEPFHYEVQGPGPSGTVSWYETHLGPILHDGRVAGLTLLSTDITERKRAEEALRQRENQLRIIFENANDVILLLDEAGTVIECNRRLRDIFGYEPEEVIGRNFNEFTFANPEIKEQVIAEFTKMIETRKTVLLPFEARRKDGSRMLIEAGASLLHSPTGTEGALVLLRDITERRRAEEREREAERLRELDRMRTELLANVSHELRTPLTTIKGYASILADYPESLKPEEKRQYLGAIEKSADRLNELVESLLDMSRLESGMLRMECKPADIGAVLRQAVEEARMRSPKHTFAVSLPPNLPPASFDPRRIRQVLDNILDNAVKYSRQGTTVTAQVSQSDSGLVVSVSDEGMGIPANELKRVFDRMYRIRTDQTARVSGMGLGLSIAKGIVEAHGGRIWMESIEGKGSTCFFTLPLEAKEAGHDESKDDPHH